MQRGFVNDNVLHTEEYGDIHFSSYIPESYDGTFLGGGLLRSACGRTGICPR